MPTGAPQLQESLGGQRQAEGRAPRQGSVSFYHVATTGVLAHLWPCHTFPLPWLSWFSFCPLDECHWFHTQWKAVLCPCRRNSCVKLFREASLLPHSSVSVLAVRGGPSASPVACSACHWTLFGSAPAHGDMPFLAGL